MITDICVCTDKLLFEMDIDKELPLKNVVDCEISILTEVYQYLSRLDLTDIDVCEVSNLYIGVNGYNQLKLYIKVIIKTEKYIYQLVKQVSKNIPELKVRGYV